MRNERTAPLWCLAALGAALCVPLAAHGNGTLSFVWESQDGEGDPLTVVQNFADGDVLTFATEDGLRIYAGPSLTPFWAIELTPPEYGERMRAACYERAASPRSVAHRPGLDFSYGGVGFSSISGRYRILDVATTTDGHVARLAVDFAQQTDGMGAAIFGKIRYATSVPLDTPSMEPTYQTGGTMDFTTEAGVEHAFALDRFLFVAGTRADRSLGLDYPGAAVSSEYWDLDLAAADGAPIANRSYVDAERYPFQSSGHPGLDFSYDSHGCNDVGGSFDVFDVAYDRIAGAPTRLHASFARFCEQSTTPLTGHIDFTTTFINGPLVDDTLSIDGFDGSVRWPLVWDCQ
jgi:hypothetical protein